MPHKLDASCLIAYRHVLLQDHHTRGPAHRTVEVRSAHVTVTQSYTDSGDVILHRETDSTRDSHPAGLGLLAELLTCGVDPFSGIIEDARDFACDDFEVLPLLH